MASIRQRETGKWQAQIRRRGLRPTVKTFANKVDAQRWARVLESEIDRGFILDRSEAERTTMAAAIDRYLREVTPLKTSASREEQRLKALRKYFGAYSLAALRSSHVASYRDDCGYRRPTLP